MTVGVPVPAVVSTLKSHLPVRSIFACARALVAPPAITIIATATIAAVLPGCITLIAVSLARRNIAIMLRDEPGNEPQKNGGGQEPAAEADRQTTNQRNEPEDESEVNL